MLALSLTTGHCLSLTTKSTRTFLLVRDGWVYSLAVYQTPITQYSYVIAMWNRSCCSLTDWKWIQYASCGNEDSWKSTVIFITPIYNMVYYCSILYGGLHAVSLMLRSWYLVYISWYLVFRCNVAYIVEVRLETIPAGNICHLEVVGCIAWNTMQLCRQLAWRVVYHCPTVTWEPSDDYLGIYS